MSFTNKKLQVMEDVVLEFVLFFNMKAIQRNISGVAQNKKKVHFSELTELHHPTFLITTRMIIFTNYMCSFICNIFSSGSLKISIPEKGSSNGVEVEASWRNEHKVDKHRVLDRKSESVPEDCERKQENR